MPDQSAARRVRQSLKSLYRNRYVRAAVLAIAVDGVREFSAVSKVMALNLLDGIVELVIVFIAVLVVQTVWRKLNSQAEPAFDSELPTKIRDVIRDAREEIIIVSPYLRPGNLIVEELVRRINDGIAVKVIHASDQLQNSDFLTVFRRLSDQGVVFYHHPRLHAKIYLNESTCVIGSMNLLATSAENSIEAGVVLDHPKSMDEVRKYIQGVLASDLTEVTSSESANAKEGFCIKTQQRIPLNPYRPVAYDVFRRDRSPEGRYCHYCGAPFATTIDAPFCEDHIAVRDST